MAKLVKIGETIVNTQQVDCYDVQLVGSDLKLTLQLSDGTAVELPKTFATSAELEKFLGAVFEVKWLLAK